MNAVEVTGLKKSYARGFWLTRVPTLKGINFQIPKGKITGFLGSNGSGKTTTIKCILDLVRFEAGSIKILGMDSQDPAARRRIGFLPERPYFYEYLTGREFLRFYGQLAMEESRPALNQRIEEVLKKIDLVHAGDKYLRTYSKGMLQRIGLGQAVLHRPELLILDEPMSGLDPDGRAIISNLIREIADSGTTVFFSTHLLPDVENLCERLLILRNGEVAYDGTKKDLLQTLKSDYVVRFFHDNREQELRLPDLSQAQKMVDQLRAENKAILELRPDRPSLEVVYMSFAKDKA